MSKEIITIIVPAYNVDKYIGECLDSLIHQSKTAHKIVIVNDGSTDNTESVVLEYKNNNPDMITYIYQDNMGLGKARNTGMEHIDTPFFAFLDSDDWLNRRYVELFIEFINKCDELPDLIFTLPWIFNSANNRIEAWMDKEIYENIFNTDKFINVRVCPKLYSLEVNACRKIYKTEFVKRTGFSFPVNLKWEDVPGHFYLLHEANTCAALDNIGFFYRINRGGQITQGSGKSRLDMIPIFKQLFDIQNHCGFNQTERAYVIELIIKFSIWSIDVCSTDYIDSLLRGLREIFRNIPKEDVAFYLRNLSKKPAYDRGFIICIRSNDYLKLRDYEKRNKIISKIKFGIYYRGLQCIHDHGTKYTCKLAAKKICRKIVNKILSI